MTYEIEIVEPSVQRIIEELAKLNLIKFRQKSADEADEPTREDVLEGWRENVIEVRAAIRGEKSLLSAWTLLAELEKEAACP
jgi:hypothetical protein